MNVPESVDFRSLASFFRTTDSLRTADATQPSRRVGVGGVYWVLNLACTGFTR